MQQRNVQNEIMIAVGAVLIIGFGLAFAILLTGSPEAGQGTPVMEVSSPAIQAETEEATSTVEPTDEIPPSAEATNTSTATEEPVVEPTLTDEVTATDAATATDEPTITQEASSTSEPVATEEAAEPTNRPRSTNTPTEDVTRGSNEPSATPRLIGRVSRTPRATDTEAPAEPTASNTRRPSATPTTTSSPTNTPSPSRTPRPSITPSPTLTQRPSATPTSQNAITGIIPTPPPSPTVPPLNQPSRTPSSCQLPQGWTTYTVLAGNTLFAIALATNSTVDELRTANCIENIDNIQAGDVVFVPRAPLTPVATFVNSGGRPGLGAIGCQNPNMQITSPIPSQRLNGTFTVYGSATRGDFLYYKIEIRPDAASIYNFYMDSRNQVLNGVLGEINSELFGSGLHWLKLTVVDLSASIPTDASCEIPVIFE